MTSRVPTLALFALAMAATAAYVAPRLRIDSDIAAIAPTSRTDDLALSAAHDLARGASSRAVAVSVHRLDGSDPSAVGARIESTIARAPIVASTARRAVPLELRRISDAIDAAPEALGGDGVRPTPASLARATEHLRELLGTPFAADHVARIPRDPLLLRLAAWDRVARLAPRGRGEIRDGLLRTRDGRGVVVAFTLRRRASPDDVGALVARVDRIARGARASTRWSGVLPITARATKSIREDVQRVSTFSTIGVLALLGLAFGRPRYVLVAALPLAAATLASLAVGVALYGRIHGIALAFVGAMIGVVVDYVEHFLAHRALSPVGTESRAILTEIRPSLALAAATTFVGVSGFALSGQPGFREISVLSAVGVLAGLVTTLVVVPELVGPHEGSSKLQLAAGRLARRVVRFLRASRRRFGAVAALVALASAITLSGARLLDDPSRLSGVPDDAMQDDARVRAELGLARTTMVASAGASCDGALVEADRARVALARALPESDVRSITTLAPSADAQRARVAAVRAVPESTYREALGAADFDVEAFAPFFTSLRQAPTPVEASRLAALAPTVLGASVVRGPRRCWVLASVDGATADRVARALPGNGASVVLASRHLHARAYRDVQRRVIAASLVGFVAVVGVCFLRYRRVRRTLVACAPAFLAALAALALASLRGPLDLLHWLGALMVASMGTDYGIFFVDSRHEDDAIDATFASVVVSALTTILSFGMLAASHHRALASLGFTTAVGVTLAVVLAPTALVLMESEVGE